MKKLLKLPFRIAALLTIVMLLVFQLIGSILMGLSSIVTNLLSSVFLVGAVAGWAVNAPCGMFFQAAGIGIFFTLVPPIAGWMLSKVTDLMLAVLDFMLS